jgi:hypothetical protein
MEIRKLYEYALQREYEGKRFFETNASRLSHSAAVAAFNRLAAEEQKHIEFVQAQIAAIDSGKKVYPGSRIFLDVQEADIKAVFRLLAEQGKVSIVSGEARPS